MNKLAYRTVLYLDRNQYVYLVVAISRGWGRAKCRDPTWPTFVRRGITEQRSEPITAAPDGQLKRIYETLQMLKPCQNASRWEAANSIVSKNVPSPPTEVLSLLVARNRPPHCLSALNGIDLQAAENCMRRCRSSKCPAQSGSGDWDDFLSFVFFFFREIQLPLVISIATNIGICVPGEFFSLSQVEYSVCQRFGAWIVFVLNQCSMQSIARCFH